LRWAVEISEGCRKNHSGGPSRTNGLERVERADAATRLAGRTLNWTKALQAESEFRRFLLTPVAKAQPVHGAIVFFETFQGAGWERKAKSRLLENGWNHWYANYFNMDGYRADLFRLSHGAIEHYGLALANTMIANIERLPDEDKQKVLAAVSALDKPPPE
jgi:hypothetical protein